jgi:hypothetical protein
MKPDIHRRCVTRCSGGRRPQLDAKAVDEPARREGLGAGGGSGSRATLRACKGAALGTRECTAPPHAESIRHTAGPAMAIDQGLITPADVTTLHDDRSAVARVGDAE